MPMNSTLAQSTLTTGVSRLQRLKTRRKLWLKVHLWLGLGFGLFLAIIGLTGSILVFWQEIDATLNPTLYHNSSPVSLPKPIDEIIAAGENAAPSGFESAWVQVPQEEDGNYIFGFYYPKFSAPPENALSFNIAINPYTATAVGQRVFYHGWNPLKHSFVGFFFKLHYALFLGEIGVTLVGILAVLFIISVLTGLILWWPITGNWRRGLTIKRKASIERFNHDLHQTTGFYTLIVLLALLMSGLYFNLPDQFRWLVERFSPLTHEAKPSPALPHDALVLERALQQAKSTNLGGIIHTFDLNNGKQGLFSVCFRDVPELKRYVIAERCLVFNRTDGELLQIKDPAHGSSGDLFMQWQWPLHSGQAFGWTGRILVFISGLICPILFVTGLIRWLQKRRAYFIKQQKSSNLN